MRILLTTFDSLLSRNHIILKVRFGASSRRYVVETEINYAATAKAKLLSSLSNPAEALKVREEDTARLFVGGLPYGWGASEIREEIERSAACSLDAILDVHLPTNIETGQSRGFAFVKVASLELARRLAGALDGADVGEGDTQRTLSANIARSGGGAGGGGSTKGERRERKRQRVNRD